MLTYAYHSLFGTMYLAKQLRVHFNIAYKICVIIFNLIYSLTFGQSSTAYCRIARLLQRHYRFQYKCLVQKGSGRV